MNGSLFSEPRYMNGVGFEMSGCTSTSKMTAKLSPPPTPHPDRLRLCYVMLCYVMLCCVVLCCVALRCVALRCASCVALRCVVFKFHYEKGVYKFSSVMG